MKPCSLLQSERSERWEFHFKIKPRKIFKHAYLQRYVKKALVILVLLLLSLLLLNVAFAPFALAGSNDDSGSNSDIINASIRTSADVSASGSRGRAITAFGLEIESREILKKEAKEKVRELKERVREEIKERLESESESEGGIEYRVRGGERIKIILAGKDSAGVLKKIRIHMKNVSVLTDLNLTSEGDVNGTVKLHARIRNGSYSEVKVMPVTASEKALLALRLKRCNESNNCTIELKEVGIGSIKGRGESTVKARIAYEVEGEKHYKFLGIFKSKARVKAEIDAESGDVILTKKPWWASLSSEAEENAETSIL